MSGADLTRTLLMQFPEARPTLTEFPSGAFMIDIIIKDVPMVAEHIVGLGYGLSVVSSATFGWEGVDHAFTSIEALQDEIVLRLSEARVIGNLGESNK